MVCQKQNYFQKGVNWKLTSFAKALCTIRGAILKLLLKKQQCICGDLVNEIQLAQSTIRPTPKRVKSWNYSRYHRGSSCLLLRDPKE